MISGQHGHGPLPIRFFSVAHVFDENLIGCDSVKDSKASAHGHPVDAFKFSRQLFVAVRPGVGPECHDGGVYLPPLLQCQPKLLVGLLPRGVLPEDGRHRRSANRTHRLEWDWFSLLEFGLTENGSVPRIVDGFFALAIASKAPELEGRTIGRFRIAHRESTHKAHNNQEPEDLLDDRRRLWCPSEPPIDRSNERIGGHLLNSRRGKEDYGAELTSAGGR
jgi:hypothetical protein